MGDSSYLGMLGLYFSPPSYYVCCFLEGENREYGAVIIFLDVKKKMMCDLLLKREKKWGYFLYGVEIKGCFLHKRMKQKDLNSL